MVHNAHRLLVMLAGICLYTEQVSAQHPRLWHYGCHKWTYYHSYIMNDTILPFNAPGPCVDFCLTRVPGNFTIGLQNTTCYCLQMPFNASGIDGTSGDCSRACPGNPYHFCGNSGNNDSFSAYIVERNISAYEERCIAVHTDRTIFEEPCDKLHIQCFGKGPSTTVEYLYGTFSVNWTDTKNTDPKYYDFSSFPWMFNEATLVRKEETWLRAFDKYAPYVCAKPPEVENSTVTEVHGQVGDWANYTCNSGYEHAAGNLSRKCLWNGSYGSWSGNEPVCQEATKKGETTINLQNSTAPNTTPITVNGVKNTTNLHNSTAPNTTPITDNGVKNMTNLQNSTAPNTTPITENGVKNMTNLQNSTAPNTTPITENGETDKKWLILAAVTAVESIAIITMAIILVKERKNLRCCNSRVMDETTVNGHAGQLIKVQNVGHQYLHGLNIGLPSSPVRINAHQHFHGHVNGDKIVQGHVDGDIPAQGHVDGDKPTQGHVDGDKHVQQHPPIGSEASKQAQTGSASRQLPPIGSDTVQHPPTGSVTGQSLVANGFSKIKPETFGEERASISKAPGSLNDDFNQDIDQHNDKQSRKSKKHPDETPEERHLRKERRRLKKERKRQEEESKQSKENENEHIIE